MTVSHLSRDFLPIFASFFFFGPCCFRLGYARDLPPTREVNEGPFFFLLFVSTDARSSNEPFFFHRPLRTPTPGARTLSYVDAHRYPVVVNAPFSERVMSPPRPLGNRFLGFRRVGVFCPFEAQ